MPSTVTSTVLRSRSPLDPSEYADAAKHFRPLIPADQYPCMNAPAQRIIDGTHHGVHDFEFGPELILDGLERLRDRTDAVRQGAIVRL